MSIKVPFQKIEGEKVIKIEGLKAYSDKVTFHCESGNIYEMFHPQDCCEVVDLVDIEGGEEELLGQIITKAEETIENSGCCQYTFYNISTKKGTVFLRWNGESYYYSLDIDVWMSEAKAS